MSSKLKCFKTSCYDRIGEDAVKLPTLGCFHNICVNKGRGIVLFSVFVSVLVFSFLSYHFILIVVVVLLFYVHGKQLRSCRDGQLI